MGRETLIAAARTLLQEMPPAQVTIAAIAREAGADPALVRYYFGSREALLFEVAREMAGRLNLDARADPATPVAMLEGLVRNTFRFSRSTRYMQRMLTEDLGATTSPEIREKLRQWQHTPVAAYQRVRDGDGGRELADFSPLFLHLAVLGISDFFHTGRGVVHMLAPEGTDPVALEAQYRDFIVTLLLDGLRKR